MVVAVAAAGLQKLRGRPLVLASVIELIGLTQLVMLFPLLA
jgi:hypothetical protein